MTSRPSGASCARALPRKVIRSSRPENWERQRLPLLERNRRGLIVLDLGLPDIDGVDVLGQHPGIGIERSR